MTALKFPVCILSMASHRSCGSESANQEDKHSPNCNIDRDMCKKCSKKVIRIQQEQINYLATMYDQCLLQMHKVSAKYKKTVKELDTLHAVINENQCDTPFVMPCYPATTQTGSQLPKSDEKESLAKSMQKQENLLMKINQKLSNMGIQAHTASKGSSSCDKYVGDECSCSKCEEIKKIIEVLEIEISDLRASYEKLRNTKNAAMELVNDIIRISRSYVNASQLPVESDTPIHINESTDHSESDEKRIF